MKNPPYLELCLEYVWSVCLQAEIKVYSTCYPTKSYVVGTQKNRLTETILLSTHNIGFECQIRILEHEKCPISRALFRKCMICLFAGGDQGLLNLYFDDWATKDINKHLPFIYNVVSQAFYSYLPAFTQYVSTFSPHTDTLWRLCIRLLLKIMWQSRNCL